MKSMSIPSSEETELIKNILNVYDQTFYDRESHNDILFQHGKMKPKADRTNIAHPVSNELKSEDQVFAKPHEEYLDPPNDGDQFVICNNKLDAQYGCISTDKDIHTELNIPQLDGVHDDSFSSEEEENELQWKIIEQRNLIIPNLEESITNEEKIDDIKLSNYSILQLDGADDKETDVKNAR